MKRRYRSYHGSHRSGLSLRAVPWKKIGLYSLSFFLLFVIESGFFSNLTFMSVPALHIGFLTALCFFEDAMPIFFSAVIIGYFTDVFNSSALTLRPAFYLFLFILLFALSKRLLPLYRSYLLLLLAASFGSSLFSLLGYMITYRSFPGGSYFPTVFFPETVATFVCCLPLYFAAKGIRRFAEHRRNPSAIG